MLCKTYKYDTRICSCVVVQLLLNSSWLYVSYKVSHFDVILKLVLFLDTVIIMYHMSTISDFHACCESVTADKQLIQRLVRALEQASIEKLLCKKLTNNDWSDKYHLLLSIITFSSVWVLPCWISSCVTRRIEKYHEMWHFLVKNNKNF